MYPSHNLLKIIGYSNNMIKNQKFKLKIKKKSVLIGVSVRVADIAAIFFFTIAFENLVLKRVSGRTYRYIYSYI